MYNVSTVHSKVSSFWLNVGLYELFFLNMRLVSVMVVRHPGETAPKQKTSDRIKENQVVVLLVRTFNSVFYSD